jgi:hypothetical protein
MRNYVLPSSSMMKPQSKEKVNDVMHFSQVTFSSNKTDLSLNISWIK